MNTHTTRSHFDMMLASMFRPANDIQHQLRAVEAKIKLYHSGPPFQVSSLIRLQTDHQVAMISLDPWLDTGLRTSIPPPDNNTNRDDAVRFDSNLFSKLYTLYSMGRDQLHRITEYIQAYPSLLQPLLEIHPQLEKFFGDNCRSSLMIYIDPEEAFKKLFLEISLRTSPEDAFNKKRRFMRECFSGYSLSVKSKLSVDIRLQ